MPRETSPCLCGDPECSRCFPVRQFSEDDRPEQNEITEVHFKTEPGERVIFVVTIIGGDVTLRSDQGVTIEDFDLVEAVILALLAQSRQRYSRKQ